MYQQILFFMLISILLPSCSITKNTLEQNEESLILSQITPDISITYRKDGTFVSYTCDTKITHQQSNKNYESIIQQCKEKISHLFENNQTRAHLKSQILETLYTVPTDNNTEDLQQFITNLLLSIISKSSTKFDNISIKKKNHSRNAKVSISFSY